MYALILAGGVGSRMWPQSRRTVPKQFLDITGGETMIQTTVRRILPIIPAEQIFVATGERYVALVREQLPMLPAENVIAEISGKNTAPAIGLGALHIARKNPHATMAVLTADHLIPNEAAFRAALQTAASVAETGKLVTLGITPTGPETGYGYIHRGASVGEFGRQTVFHVNQFLEKPTLPTAQTFFHSGEYYWNSGMFVWKTDALFNELHQHMPMLMKKLTELSVAIFENADSASVEKIWDTIESQSIDFGLMEKAADVAVVPLDAGWNDVGSWAALYDELADTADGNVAVNAEHLSVESHGLLIQGGGKLVATIGVNDLVIVETDDALLVCARDRAQDVKKIVEQLKSNEKQAYL